MSIKYISLTFCFLLLSCGNIDKTFEENKTQNIDQSVKYDTIIIDYEVINKMTAIRNEIFLNLKLDELVDSLKSQSLVQGIIEINETGLPFNDPQSISKYYRNNIPLSIYKKIFPTEKIEINRVRETTPFINKKENIVRIQKGARVTEKRRYNSLLSLIEKEKYLQLLLTTQGKYVPEVELVTVSKTNLNRIEHLSLYGGIYDSYDIDYWHSAFKNNYTEVIVERVQNKSTKSIDLDTIQVHYKVSDQGEILKWE